MLALEWRERWQLQIIDWWKKRGATGDVRIKDKASDVFFGHAGKLSGKDVE